VNPAGQWALDDVDALDQAEGEASNSFGGRSAVEQRLIYGSDPFSLGHPVDGETDNVEGLGDVRLKVHRFSSSLHIDSTCKHTRALTFEKFRQGPWRRRSNACFPSPDPWSPLPAVSSLHCNCNHDATEDKVMCRTHNTLLCTTKCVVHNVVHNTLCCVLCRTLLFLPWLLEELAVN
jgi:hypothetical protein